MDKTATGDSAEFLNQLVFQPLSKDNWDKFVELFGERGACGNCWCMAYRLPRREFRDGRANDVNKNRMKEVVWNNKPAGMLAFHDGKAIAWCAVAPREDFIRFEKSRVHKRIDDKPVWSIPCLFVHRKFRMKGVSAELLKAIIAYAKQKGIMILEAYPVIPTQERLPDAFAWIGLYSSFEKAGFEVVDRTSRNRPMVRYYTEK